MKLPAIRQLPSGNWFCQLRLDGRSISITEPTYDKCKARAMAYKAGLLTARKTPQSVTLSKACDDYIDARRAIRSPTTIRGYEVIRNFAFQGLMGKRLSDLTPRAYVYVGDGYRDKDGNRCVDALYLDCLQFAEAK